MNTTYHTILHTIAGLLPWIIILVVIPIGTVAAIGWFIQQAMEAIA